MIKSNSSQIAEFGYDAARRVLCVKFRSGGEWEYSDFSEEKFAEMQAAESHGKFLAARIKPYHNAVKMPPKPETNPQIPLANSPEPR